MLSPFTLSYVMIFLFTKNRIAVSI